MRPAPLALAAAVIAFLAAFNLYSIVYAANHNIPTVIVLSRYYWDGEIVLCPPEELRDDAQWAAEKWSRAIQYFSIRYMLLDAAKTRIRVSSEGDDRCNIFFEYLDTPIGCEGGAVVAGVEFIEPPSSVLNMEAATPLKAAKIYLWRGLDDQGRRAMILHEIARLLGVVKLFYSRQPPYRSASEPWGSLDVTSIDVYALFLKNRYAGASGELIEAMVPWTLPYTTVEEDLFHTSIALCVSVIAAIIAYLALSGRWEVAG
jgi:hypothetical protein